MAKRWPAYCAKGHRRAARLLSLLVAGLLLVVLTGAPAWAVNTGSPGCVEINGGALNFTYDNSAGFGSDSRSMSSVVAAGDRINITPTITGTAPTAHEIILLNFASPPQFFTDPASGVTHSYTYAGFDQSQVMYQNNSGDGTGTTSIVVTCTPAVAATTTTVTSSANPTIAGQSVTFTAAVCNCSGIATGSMQFSIDGVAQGAPVPLDGSGAATYTTSALAVATHSVTANYIPADGTFLGSTGTLAGGQTVNKATTSLIISRDIAGSAVYGQPITFTATLGVNSPGGGTPSGSVTFSDGTNSVSVPLSAGHASWTTSSLPIGATFVVATYAGDASYLGSTNNIEQSVSAGTTTTTLASSQNPSGTGQAVTFTATVAPVAPSVATPTGSVVFSIDGVAQSPVPLSGGRASLTTAALATGNRSITASYAGNANYAGSASSTLVQIVAQNATTTALSSSPNPSAPGQSVTFTVTVVKSGGSGQPTGTVTFKEGATTLGTATLDAAGSASFSTVALGVGSHAITAAYGGDGNFLASASSVLTQVVGSNATSVTLASSANPSAVGQAVVFTATVVKSGGSSQPTGIVTFKDGGSTLGTATLDGAGTANFATAALGAGSHAITAAYGGDGVFGGNTSAVLTQTVNLATTTTTLASSKNPSEVGQTVTFSATVSSPGGVPTGLVNFLDGGTVIGSVTVAGGVAALSTSALTLGSHSITAAYAGAAGYAASTSATLTQAVNTPGDSIKLRSLQLAVTPLVAQTAGQTITGAIDNAISEGFSQGGELITPSAGGIRFNFAADPEASTRGEFAQADAGRWSDPLRAAQDGTVPGSTSTSLHGRQRPPADRVDQAFASLDRNAAPKQPRPRHPSDWLAWAEVRGTGWETSPTREDIHGTQVHALTGLTRKLGPDLLVGVLGGYETFDYSSQPLNGRLKGDGWTVGAYLGWRLSQGVRFDAGVARSSIDYNGVAGSAAGSFSGARWLASAGLTGTYLARGFEIEPSAKIYGLWEEETAYTDTLGTQQPARTFYTARASGGLKLSYPIKWSEAATIAPYAGVYGDYYFSHDEAAALLLPSSIIDGWSARLTGGVALGLGNGVRMALGGEIGGLGSGTHQRWSLRGRAAVPF